MQNLRRGRYEIATNTQAGGDAQWAG